MGIHCVNNVGSGGIIAQFLNSRLITDSSWKCSNTSALYWSTSRFNSDTWPEAYVIGEHGISPWYTVEGIDTAAMWIWTPNWQGGTDGDGDVRCRKVIDPTGNVL